MGYIKFDKLPFILAVIPFLVELLAALATLNAFDWLRSFVDILSIIFFFPIMLLYDSIGLIRFNILGGKPTLLGSYWFAVGLYTFTSSVILFFIGKLILKIFHKA
jgi:ABC-type uncharacterized transport system fused permease/ATPase subunit